MDRALAAGRKTLTPLFALSSALLLATLYATGRRRTLSLAPSLPRSLARSLPPSLLPLPLSHSHEYFKQQQPPRPCAAPPPEATPTPCRHGSATSAIVTRPPRLPSSTNASLAGGQLTAFTTSWKNCPCISRCVLVQRVGFGVGPGCAARSAGQCQRCDWTGIAA